MIKWWILKNCSGIPWKSWDFESEHILKIILSNLIIADTPNYREKQCFSVPALVYI
jgi:hypothetical protein